MKRKGFLFSWAGFSAVHLVSATVENDAPTNVVLTYSPSVKPFTRVVKENFALVGKTVESITIDPAAATVTVTVTVAYTAGAGFNLTFTPAYKGTTLVIPITNNVE